MLKNEHAAALVEIEQEPEEPWRLLALVTAYHALGRTADSDQKLEEMIDKYGQDWPYNIAYAIAFRGEADRAFEWLAKAKEINDPGLSEIVSEPLFDNVRADPRWVKFIETIGKTQQDLSAVEFKVTRPE